MQVSKHHHTLCGTLISLIQFVFHLILKSCIIFCSILELVCQRSQYPCRTSWQHLALSKLMDNSGYTVPSSHNALKCEKSKILGNVTIMVTNKFLRVCSVSQKKTLILAFEAISVNFYTSIFFKFQRIVPFYCLKFGSVSKAETTWDFSFCRYPLQRAESYVCQVNFMHLIYMPAGSYFFRLTIIHVLKYIIHLFSK